jgi:hypothetical protein
VPHEIRRNQHALRAVSRRTPTPMLLPLLRACSFRLVNDASAWRFRRGLARSLRYFLRPLIPFLRNRSVSRRRLPTEATLGDRRLGRRIESTHPLQRMGPKRRGGHWQNRTVPRAFNCMACSRRQGRTPPFPASPPLTALASPGGEALRKARSECACLV